MGAFELQQGHAAIDQLRHKVGVKAPTRCGQTKAAGRGVQVAHPLAHARMAVDQLSALELLPALFEVSQHRKVVLAELVAPAVTRGLRCRIAVGLEHMGPGPVGLDQPGTGIALLQHALAKLLLRCGITQTSHVGLDGARQLKTCLRQRHQRHTAGVQLMADDSPQVGTALALGQVVQRLEQQLVQPAHHVLRGDAAVAVFHRHLFGARGAHRDALALQVDQENIRCLHHLKTWQLHRVRTEQIQLHGFQHGAALQRPQRRLRVGAVAQRGQRRKRHATRSGR